MGVGSLVAASLVLATGAEARDLQGGAGYAIEVTEATSGTEAVKVVPKSTGPSGGATALIGVGLALGAMMALGSGGSGGDESNDTKASGPGAPSTPPARPAPPEPVVPEPADPVRPNDSDPGRSFRTPEFERNYGLGLINADRRYAGGATGRGSLIAVYDSGARTSHVELSANIDRGLSYNYFTRTTSVEDTNGHGTHVASIIAGARNGRGAHGVAYDARLMILKGLGDAQDHATRTLDGRLTFADAQMRAVDAGAVAINHSWAFADFDGSTRTIDEFSGASDLRSYYGSDLVSALTDSARAGLVTVYATANDGHRNPSVNAGAAYYLGSNVRQHSLAVTAIDEAGRIAGFANRCGIAMQFCLAAPGTAIPGAGLDQETILMSGTSMAAPHVSGAVGLLKSNFPELTGGEIAQILLETARDAGAPGTDAVYGRGILDLTNAVTPQGRLTIQSSDDIRDGGDDLSDSYVVANGAMASALQASFAGRDMMVSDHYDRGYSVGLAAMVSEADAMAPVTSRLQSFAMGAGHSLDLARGRAVELGAGSAGGWADGDTLAAPYATLVDAPRLAFSEAFGDYSVTVSTAHSQDEAAFASASLTTHSGPAAFSFELGTVAESGSMLGSDVTGGFGKGMNTTTRFARIGLEVDLDRHTSLLVSGALGRSDFSSEGIIRSGSDITTNAIGIGLAQDAVFRSTDTLSIGLSRNLSIDGGRLSIDMPVAMAASTGASRATGVTREMADLDLEGAVAPTDLQIGYSTDLGPGRLALGGIWRPELGAEGVALSAGFTVRF